MVAKSASLRHSLWSIADNFSQQALSFIIFAILARWLSPKEFGLLAIAHLIVQFVRLSLLDAVAIPILRLPQIERLHFRWLFTQCVLVSTIAAAVMAACAMPLAMYFESPTLTSVVVGMSFVIILYGLNRAYDAVLLRQADFRLLALRSLISVAAGGVVAMLLARAGYGAMALVAQQLTTTALAFFISLGAEWRRWRPGWLFSLPMLREHGGESLRASVSSMLLYANGNGDAALVSAVLGPHAAGLYNLGKRVTSAISLMIAAAMSRVASSMFYRNADDTRALGEHYCHIGGLTLSGLMLIYGLVANFADGIVPIVFGPQWRAASPLLVVLAVAALFQANFNIGQGLSMATGHAARSVRLGALQLIVAVLLALSLLHVFTQQSQHQPLTGMALGFCIATAISALAMHWHIARQLQLRRDQALLPLLPPLCGLLALTVCAQWSLQRYGEISTWLHLIVVNAAAGLAYLIGFAAAQWLARSALRIPARD